MDREMVRMLADVKRDKGFVLTIMTMAKEDGRDLILFDELKNGKIKSEEDAVRFVLGPGEI